MLEENRILNPAGIASKMGLSQWKDFQPWGWKHIHWLHILWLPSDHWSTPTKWILIGSTKCVSLHKLWQFPQKVEVCKKKYKRKRKQNKISSPTLQLSNCLLLFYKIIFSNSGLKHFANSSEYNSSLISCTSITWRL